MTFWHRFRLCLTVLASGVPAGLAAQVADSALLARDRLWNEWRLTGDTERLAGLLADDWMLIHSDGRTQSKADYLGELRRRARTNQRIDNDSVTVRRYGPTAVVTGISVQSGISNGQPWEGRFRFTRVWILSDGLWLMVASHSSRIAAGG